MAVAPNSTEVISIDSLLRLLADDDSASAVTADEIAVAVSHIFTGQLGFEQTTALLGHLQRTQLDLRPDVIAKCAAEMRACALPVDVDQLATLVKRRNILIGNYHGGPCDIVGTGGDGHSTFNISTASSIVASSLLLIAKHGNRASTSLSGSADLLQNLRLPQLRKQGNRDIIYATPNLSSVTPQNLLSIFSRTNYAFFFAPLYHSGMRHAKASRDALKPRYTLFNVLGPLANPVDSILEARIIGVRAKPLGPIFAEVLRLSGVRKGMVVCGDENLDEISCAGVTHCWRLVAPLQDVGAQKSEVPVTVEYFTLQPSDFDLPVHKLSEVAPGGSSAQNASTLLRLLLPDYVTETPPQPPDAKPSFGTKTLSAINDFVLLNTAALLVISGVCDGETSALVSLIGDTEAVITEVGPGGGRWKEGVRLARKAIESGRALEMLMTFAEVTTALGEVAANGV